MANGDCTVGARHDENIKELTRRMTALESTVEKTCQSVQRHLEDTRVEKAGLTRGDKLQLAALQFIGPILLALIAWYLRASA
jgi:hypothetical protein